MKLSIIIPYHNTIELTKTLLAVLTPQLTNECELCIVDDDVNTHELDKYKNSNVQIIHHKKNSGCAGKPRNTGIDNTKGKYIAFIDSDDMISNDYIKIIIDKINTKEFDYCYMSWQYNGSTKVIITDQPPKDNNCVWNCIYKRETIGKERFNEQMKIAEDYDFNIRVRKGVKENITEVLYSYNNAREGSLFNTYGEV
jgi:glycosyltransferase involved in cell wall biosynthesis